MRDTWGEPVRKVISRLLVVATLALGGVAIAPAAQAAAYGCAGSQIDSYAETAPSGATYGHIYLYYDAATGDNCVVNVKTDAGGYGTKSNVEVEMAKCTAASDGKACVEVGNPVSNAGNFAYYAGPVTINAPGDCVAVSGSIVWDDAAAGYTSTAGHCG